MLKEINHLALTTDFWNSISNESYCGLTCHWVTSDKNLQSIALSCLNLTEHHYSINIAELYNNLVIFWNLKEKTQVLLTDNARNMVSAVEQTNYSHLPCLAHTF